jgi:hypothetical protein
METLNLYGSIPIIVSCWSFSPIKLYLEFAQDGIIVEQHPCHLRLSKKIGSYRQEYIQATCQMRKKHWKTILPFTQIFYCCKELNTRLINACATPTGEGRWILDVVITHQHHMILSIQGGSPYITAKCLQCLDYLRPVVHSKLVQRELRMP